MKKHFDVVIIGFGRPSPLRLMDLAPLWMSDGGWNVNHSHHSHPRPQTSRQHFRQFVADYNVAIDNNNGGVYTSGSSVADSNEEGTGRNP